MSSGVYRGGVLKLKGKKQLFKPKKNTEKNAKASSSKIDEDAEERGGIDIAIEHGDFSKCYLSALDNGKFTLGARHVCHGEPPNPEEILSLIKCPDEPKISLKTGFGKYVGFDSGGCLIATADAIGDRERFGVVFQDGKSALLAHNGFFLSLAPDDDGYVYVSSRTAHANEIINIRTNTEKEGPVDWLTADDKKKAADCETAYVKMYQHSRVELKNKCISYNVADKSEVKRAQREGDLHETLLNRRAKLKSDNWNVYSITIIGYDNYVTSLPNQTSPDTIRTNTEKEGPVDWLTADDKKKAADCETAYVKMYQHSRVELKNKCISYNVADKSEVKRAQREGDLHETLLNRRAKLKSDKYC
uniref:FRG1-like family protein n=1 Tax=Meloidogyne floridensis TaxID=298350 RepID=A0A915P5P9_9BILA